LPAILDFRLERIDLADAGAADRLFAITRSRTSFISAAQPGVRYSLVDPNAYFRNNLVAFGHVIDGCRHAGVAHLVYASSSSVYGASHALAVLRGQNVDHPLSLVRSDQEVERADRAQLQPSVRLADDRAALLQRVRTVGAPDMAPMLFTKAILAG
jgi:UDP-glucuronate 4-epimerase